MGDIGQSIAAILSRIARLLGIKPSEHRRLGLMEQKLAASKVSNVDRLEGLKEKIQQIEAHAIRKKHEFETATGDTKRIVGSEIERLFRELDRQRGQEAVITSNIERISTAQAKLEEYRAAQAKGLEEDEIDDIALELQQAFEELKVTDRATRDLESVDYQAPQVNRVNAEQRMAEVAGDQEPIVGLSTETEKRLKQLEAEEV